ncbi:MAG: hypothetical protein ED859_15835 [Desulfuromonadales bacterium]|nr:MAG: hypothetical protein ED859_15835 [Desulfuromonadales bacterium]
MIKTAVIAVLVFSAALPARAERLWLVIGASDPSAAALARKTKTLALDTPDSLVVQTSDCGDKKNFYAWVAEAATSPEAAHAALRRVRTAARDAYVKRCDTQPGTLLALRITAVDASIADVPETAVNWQENDRISTVRPLPDGRAIVIARYFAKVKDDPLEGRRERVILAESSDKRRVLEENCPSPGRVAMRHGRVAFHCVREEAADNLIHNVVVFDTTGEKLAEIKRCRNPKWLNELVIECEEESVGPDGQLKLRTIRSSPLPPLPSATSSHQAP